MSVDTLFQEALALMRRHDPQMREDGFRMLLPCAAEHVDDLLSEFAAERDDHGLCCWLLELISQARSPKALPVLAEQLESLDEVLRMHALSGLKLLDTKESRRLVWQWDQNSRSER